MFGYWIPSTSAEQDLENVIYLAIYALIFLVLAFVLFYLALRWALHRIYVKRINKEYEAEIRALGTHEASVSNKNLCNSGLRLVENSAQKLLSAVRI